jgi:hypothetical protein
MSSFCVVSSYSMLTGGHGGGGGAFPFGSCPRPRPMDDSRMSSNCSSMALVRTIYHNSFASLETCTSPIEYDVSLHKVNTM